MNAKIFQLSFFILVGCVAAIGNRVADGADPGQFKIATFSADITIPLGHRCMGIIKTKVKQIDDPLEAHGLVLLGADSPIVLVALDWCEVRNGAYDQWRDALAAAAMTTRDHVLVSSLHQHDAPISDSGAQRYLDTVGLQGELYDVDFHARCIDDVVRAMKAAVAEAEPLTHIGLGQAAVEKVASSRRVIRADGTVGYDRGSGSGGVPAYAAADDGEIDPMLKSITFYHDTKALAVVSCYATHPMSHYGKGAVSADFVGIARRRRQLDTPPTKQIYLSGCSGDVTAGKYNDGAPAMRAVLADRVYQAMKQAEAATVRTPLDRVALKMGSLKLPFIDEPAFTRPSMMQVLENEQATVENRISAAMGLSSLDRVERGQPIDLPCLELGEARLLLMPGESFVHYQLMAQQMSPDRFVMTVGYGECWPGYIPSEQAFVDGFDHGWRWVARGSEAIIKEALQPLLAPSQVAP
ncbi:hypothetical protein Pla52o_53370 [Novipirellula galeiformis]|uniref:Neutral/alkaline non-lysosomal ceramidase n=1 Tax=Novipirellula galeiformis TaxID=2528004 RepID=A0A5C6C122_9BACT|nr:hypothetical protein [Novipirellula galeiformis]TWU17331.1 hypothetical protein Pla52o_53370 [Novipirellula galeiformis]